MRRISDLTLIVRAQQHGERTAIVAPEGTFSYRQLLDASAQVAACLLNSADDLWEARVAFMVPPGFDYVATQWGIWRAGGVAVPLGVTHPRPELEYVIDDAQAAIVVAHPQFEAVLRPLVETRGRRLVSTLRTSGTAQRPLPPIDSHRRAMMLYTSGTTSQPKGVVITHRNIEAQVASLHAAWEWTPDDYLLHALPLHHIHGIVVALTGALWAGATCELLPRFDAEQVWERIVKGNVTLFMGVPTMYAKLIAAWEAAPPERQREMSAACAKLRLMVSGSAALPVSVLEKWKHISGHVLLERYGMTETGMVLANPLHGPRLPGCVGTPLPGVEVRLVDDDGNEVESGTPGEVCVRGAGVFLEYWHRPDATAQAFRDGWFCTGDVAVWENGAYRLLGRKSVDIIKTGGYKVSALEVEEVLREHPDIVECAVVGIPDAAWGERVGAALVLKTGRHLTLDSLRAWAKERLAAYKVPTRILILDTLPRNAMGKVIKLEVARLFSSNDAAISC
ncbi:MAG: acyl-CoA synthetase [Abditibacteriales bacterium]|nr:acyl-CoA synthetase [Abditibacteriales bacterium]MDW8366695.1 acyl-CoA synthetase [Abditibacteriales bacterium]